LRVQGLRKRKEISDQGLRIRIPGLSSKEKFCTFASAAATLA
jgi:hypothetical protein